MTCTCIPGVSCCPSCGADLVGGKFYTYQPSCQSCLSLINDVARLTKERDEARRRLEGVMVGVKNYIAAAESFIKATGHGGHL